MKAASVSASIVAAALFAAAAFGSSPKSYVATTLEARSGSQVSGTVRVSHSGRKIRLRATVSGLEPGSEHGFHLHEKGDCSAPDASSAGGHFNPSGAPHGKFGSDAHHAGDLPSLKADKKGVAKVDVNLSGLDWEGDKGVKGRAVIVHAKPDDFTTQPSGNAGARIACVVIG